MAKPEYRVANGCLQEGRRVILEGQPYSTASPELAKRLVAKGKLIEVKRQGSRPEQQATTGGE